jgi:hypothetical protein
VADVAELANSEAGEQFLVDRTGQAVAQWAPQMDPLAVEVRTMPCLAALTRTRSSGACHALIAASREDRGHAMPWSMCPSPWSAACTRARRGVLPARRRGVLPARERAVECCLVAFYSAVDGGLLLRSASLVPGAAHHAMPCVSYLRKDTPKANAFCRIERTARGEEHSRRI